MDWVDELGKITKIYEGNNTIPVRWNVTVIPKSYEEVKEIINLANKEKLSIYPYCFNTHHIGPQIKVNIGLNLSNFNQIVEISEDDLYVTSQSCIKIEELFNALRTKGLFLPAFFDGSLGGLLATNFPTIFSSFYGYPKNLVLMAKIITGDGIIVKSGGKTAKFSSGYKLHKVISGSLGWLGIYLEATLKLYPFPETIVTIKTNNVGLTSKYRPVSIIYERNEKNEESTYAIFLGFKKVIEDIEKELGAKTEDRLYRLNYEGDNAISIHVTRGKEIEEINKVYNYVKVERANCIIGTGYCRLIVKDLDHIDELRRNVNGYVVVERGEYSGDYWGFKSETMKKLKQAFDPNNILSPNLF